MLRCALGDISVRKECAEIGKTIARLVVSVNQSHDEDTLASTRERALMVRSALRNYGDRVEVVTAPGTREEKIRGLLEDRNIERLVQFIDSDAYRRAEIGVASQSRSKAAVDGISSEAAVEVSAPAVDPKTLPANAKLFVEIDQPQGSSARAVQKVIQSGGATVGLMDPAVKAVIEKTEPVPGSQRGPGEAAKIVVRRKLERIFEGS